MSAVIHVVSLCLPPCSTNTRWLFCKMFELFSSSGKIPNISWSSTSRWSNLKSWQKEVITLISTVIKGSKIVHILQKIKRCPRSSSLFQCKYNYTKIRWWCLCFKFIGNDIIRAYRCMVHVSKQIRSGSIWSVISSNLVGFPYDKYITNYLTKIIRTNARIKLKVTWKENVTDRVAFFTMVHKTTQFLLFKYPYL